MHNAQHAPSNYNLTAAKCSFCPSFTPSLAHSPTHSYPAAGTIYHPHFTGEESEPQRSEAASPELVAEQTHTSPKDLGLLGTHSTPLNTVFPPPGLVSEPPGQVPPK